MSEDKAPVGRPPKYNNKEEMQKVIDNYFSTDAFIKVGESTIFAPTVEGLAYALDMNRKTLLEYEAKDEFCNTIKRAKQRVAIALEQRLYGNNVTGIIFNLKNNFGWKDKIEQDVTSNNTHNHKVEWSIQPVKPVDKVDEEDA